ncbi:type II secretion system protein GspD [Rhizobacter sp. Root404]|nr:type II secretion system protein GspD [Rhizobacter sp. Root404]
MSMKPSDPLKPASRVLPAAIAAAVLMASLLPAPMAFAQSSKARSTRGETVTLNFVNAEIEGVARAMSAILKQPFVVDPRVKGTMTLYSDSALTPREAYVNFLAALRGLGFTVVEVGGLYKIVPEADAKLQTGTVSVGERTSRGGDQVLTQVFRLQHENANNLVPVLRPLISPNNTINANPGNNTLVITDYADNLQRIGKIIAAMDTPASGDVEVIPLKYAVAADIAPLVQRMTDSTGTGAGGAPTAPGVAGSTTASSLQIDSRSNSLLVRAPNPARMASIRALIDKLDRPVPSAGATGNVWVVYLKNADAVKLATVLRAAYGGSGAGGSSSGTGSSTQGTPTSASANTSSANTGASTQTTSPLASSGGPSTGGFVQADPSSNALIITAPEPFYKQLRAVIEQLDSRRAQVYIESLIVEVNPEQSIDFGIQWQALSNPGSRFIGGAGTNFGTSNNILANQGAPSAIEALAGLGAGGNIGLIRNFGGTNGFGLAAIARALQTQADTNILSTPNLVTLDNEEARIVVGQNVPFVTGQYTNTGTSTTSPFQTIERKDVGTTLKIKPQIGENGTVRMTIYQESSSVAGAVATGTDNAGPTTNKRSIESTITVDDGQIIVLGGLIEDNYSINRSKVPLLGDIPYIGALFRSENRTRKRSNLMVFLRPVVMRDQAASNRISLDRYDFIRGQQMNAQPPQSTILQLNESPVLPQLRPGESSPTGVPRPLTDTAPPAPVVAPSLPASAPEPVPASAPKTN